MVQLDNRIGVETNLKIINLTICCLCILIGCTNNKQIKKELTCQFIDTIYLNTNDKIIEKYSVQDLVKNKDFSEYKPCYINVNSVDSTVYKFIYNSDTLLFSYNFNIKDKSQKDRDVILNGINCKIIRVIFNGDYPSIFNGFNYDYPNAQFYKNINLILVKSFSNVSLDHRIKLYQIINKNTYVCYEFFVYEDGTSGSS